MKHNTGVWLDHRQAVIVTLSGEAAATTRVESSVEKHEHRDDVNDDTRQKEFTEHIGRYYDRIISALRDARSVFILGPGEAKEELKQRLQDHARDKRTIVVETAGQLTDPEIAAKVRHHFHDETPRIGV